MDIAIVDDSYADRIQISNYIKKYAKENSVFIRIKEYSNGEVFLDDAEVNTLDAVFLDIYMDRLGGMETAEQIRRIGGNCLIVFVSLTEAFALKSYEVRAFDYLLKPIDYEKISVTMGLLVQNMTYDSRFIVVKEGRELRKVFLSDIIYSDYNNHYVRIHTKECIISTYVKFADFEERMRKYASFLTCYRCIIVNMDKIEKIEDGFFLMNNGEYIPIKRDRSKEIKARYTSYIFGEYFGGDGHGTI